MSDTHAQEYDWQYDLSANGIAAQYADYEKREAAIDARQRLTAYIEQLEADLTAANARADEAEAERDWIAYLAALYGKRLAVTDREGYYTDEAAILERAAREAVKR